jgi:hypothetical protein
VLARIGIMKALHRQEVREFRPGAKKAHSGKRKLALALTFSSREAVIIPAGGISPKPSPISTPATAFV